MLCVCADVAVELFLRVAQACATLAAFRGRLSAGLMPHREGVNHCLGLHMHAYFVAQVAQFAAPQDPAKPVKARLAANPVAGFSKVISLTKLKKKYGQFQEKRELCASYDAFFADERILPSLSKVLGKVRPWHLCMPEYDIASLFMVSRECACACGCARPSRACFGPKTVKADHK